MNPGWTLKQAINKVAEELNERGERAEQGKDAESYVRDAYYTWMEIQKSR
jgi:hypothetical protein